MTTRYNHPRTFVDDSAMWIIPFEKLLKLIEKHELKSEWIRRSSLITPYHSVIPDVSHITPIAAPVMNPYLPTPKHKKKSKPLSEIDNVINFIVKTNGVSDFDYRQQIQAEQSMYSQPMDMPQPRGMVNVTPAVNGRQQLSIQQWSSDVYNSC